MRLDQNLTAGGIKGFKAYNVGRRGSPWTINRHETGCFRLSQTARLSGVDMLIVIAVGLVHSLVSYMRLWLH